MGTRTYRSETIKYADTSAQIVGVTTHTSAGCSYKADLRITRDGSSEVIPLPDPSKQRFSIVDFSRDGSSILLAAELWQDYPNNDYRDINIAIVHTGNPDLAWHNAWDIFRWHDCGATVDPQGFDGEGSVVVRAGPSVMHPQRQGNCISDVSLVTAGADFEMVKRLPDSSESDGTARRRVGRTRHANQIPTSSPRALKSMAGWIYITVAAAHESGRSAQIEFSTITPRLCPMLWLQN